MSLFYGSRVVILEPFSSFDTYTSIYTKVLKRPFLRLFDLYNSLHIDAAYAKLINPSDKDCSIFIRYLQFCWLFAHLTWFVKKALAQKFSVPIMRIHWHGRQRKRTQYKSESNAKCAVDSKAPRSLQKRLDATREMRRIRSPDPLSGNAKWMVKCSLTI